MEREDVDVIELFLQGARCVAGELRGHDVATAWDSQSVLEGQTVASLAGHLARGGVWVVDDYLGGGVPAAPVDYQSAAEYFLSLVTSMSPEAHRAIRDRGASVAAVGHATLMAQLDERLAALDIRLGATDPDTLVAVAAGKVLRLGDYLVTRIVEQAIHLDDLDCSLGRGPSAYPEMGRALCVEVGVAMAGRRSGPVALLRALFREGAAGGVLPVL
jgi:hypothetical protein